ncbi:GNAT family N-acetyltransferase [Flagellimonas sp.]|uniref:GNAT family N-acetyltransferase n=1 Tax=Flagellimonas sp. TaxID=2058762 RepID=UPI003B50D8AE
MEYRELNEHDAKAYIKLKRIGLESHPESFVSSIDEDKSANTLTIQKRIREASIKSGDIILGAFNPNLIGVISITRDHRTKRLHKSELHGMFVIPEYRGKGIGKTLLEKGLAKAKK